MAGVLLGWRPSLHPLRRFGLLLRGFVRGAHRCRVGGGALARWPPSAAQTVRAVFPHTAFTKALTTRHDPDPSEWGQFRICQVDPVRQSPQTMMYGFFAKGTDPPHRPYSSDFPSLPSCLRPPTSPAHSRRRFPGHTAFTALEVLFGSPTTGRASLATSLSLIGPLTPVPPGDPASPPGVTRCSSVPCHPQTPWCGG